MRQVHSSPGSTGSAARPAVESSRSEREMPTETAGQLNALLADEFVLYVRTLNYHWNVRGMQFHSLHDFLEMLYKEQHTRIDDLAERVRVMGAHALGTLAGFLEHSRIKESPGEPPDPRGMISGLCDGHETVIRHLHEIINIVDTILQTFEIIALFFQTRKLLHRALGQRRRPA